MSEYTARLDKVLARWAQWPTEVKEAVAAVWRRPVSGLMAGDTPQQRQGALGQWTRECEEEATRIANGAASEGLAEAKEVAAQFLRRYDAAKASLKRLADEAADNVDWTKHAGLVELYKAKLAATQAEPALGDSLVGAIERMVTEAGTDQTRLMALAVAVTPALVAARDSGGGSNAPKAAALLRRLHAPIEPVGEEADAARAEMAELQRKAPELVAAIGHLQRGLDAEGYRASVLEGRRELDWVAQTFGNRAYNLDWTPKAADAERAPSSTHVVVSE